MTALMIRIAEAVTADLDGAFEEFTPTRGYVPTFELGEMTDLHVTVVPRSIETAAHDRSSDRLEIAIDIGIQQKVADDDTAALDALARLVERIEARLNRRSLPDLPGVSWARSSNDPVYVPAHLRELGQFTSVLTVHYRMARKPEAS